MAKPNVKQTPEAQAYMKKYWSPTNFGAMMNDPNLGFYERELSQTGERQFIPYKVGGGIPGNIIPQENLLGTPVATPVQGQSGTPLPTTTQGSTYTPLTQGLQNYYNTSYVPTAGVTPYSYQPAINQGQVATYNPNLGTYQPLNQQYYSLPEGTAPSTGAMMGSVTLESGFPGVQPLTFDFGAEENKAYEALKPFYNRLLELAAGDLDLAKRLLAYTYEQGMREVTQEYGQANTEEAIRKAQENRALQTSQNQRGILESGFGKTVKQEQTGMQNLRQEAIERALENRSSRLAAERGFGEEEQTRGFLKEATDLETQKRKEAADITAKKYGIKSDIFGSQLQAASAKEQRDTLAKQMEMQEKIYKQQYPNLFG